MIISNILEGLFIERPNRFAVVFEADGNKDKAHLRDPGRLRELLLPEAHLLLRTAQNPVNRKTKYDVIAVESEGIWVLINSGFHSDLAAELIESGVVPELSSYRVKKREYTFGKSRIDFLLTSEKDNGTEGDLNRGKILQSKMLLEVKGCTLVEDGIGRFPDAPTTRGKRHLEELIKAKKEGMNSVVLFLIPREDAKVFSPNWEMDPDFSLALAQAQQTNVEIIAYSFKNTLIGNEFEIKPLKQVKIKI